jgi:Tol biopolymer transport system component
MDANGSGRRQIKIPDNGYMGWDLNHSVSPDGKWIAYYTGSVEEPYDLALNLLNLSDGTSKLISNLIAPGFPENLEPVTKTIYLTEDDSDCSSNPTCTLSMIQWAFQESILHALDWSPDDKLLAFAAQIDGPSSDLYIFNIEDKSIRRITDELENIWKIHWSPNGEKILYLDSVPGTIYMSRYIRIADPKIERIQHPKEIDGGAFWSGEDWIDDHTYLLWNGGEGAPPQKFRLVNSQTQQIKEIWKYESEMFSVSPELNGILLTLYPEVVEYDQIPIEPGTYFISVNGKSTKITDEFYDLLEEPGFSNSFFVRKDRNLYSIRIDEPTTQLIKENVDFEHSPRLSANKKWLMVEGYDGLQLYSENLELIKSWEIRNSEMIWRPDSRGLFLFVKTAMYYLSVPDDEPTLMEDCAPDYCSIHDYVWLP